MAIERDDTTERLARIDWLVKEAKRTPRPLERENFKEVRARLDGLQGFLRQRLPLKRQ
jgi:hypothetical protein